MCTNHKNRLLRICAWILWFLYKEAQNLYLAFHLVKTVPLKGDFEWFSIGIILNKYNLYNCHDFELSIPYPFDPSTEFVYVSSLYLDSF